jgi:hypothetical protein
VKDLSDNPDEVCLEEKPNLSKRIDKLLKEDLNEDSRYFVESLKDFLATRGGLTPRQRIAFGRIESRYSPEQKEKLEEWKKEYFETEYERAKIIAKYYLKAGYYATVARNIIDKPDFVPEKKHYNKMMSNKYAQKVYTETIKEPQFKIGELVKIRETYGNNFRNKTHKDLKGVRCFVIANNLEILNAVKGGKRYEVLPMGHSGTIEIDERFLKKGKKIS